MNYKALVAVMLAISACARAPMVVHPVVDIPPYPSLPVCVEAHAQGQMSGDMVAFTREEIDGYAATLAVERACRVEREALVEAWGKKLLNRLKAVTGP